VLDIPGNVAGEKTSCTGVLNYQIQSKQQTVVLQVVEPRLFLQTAVNDTVGDAGDSFIVTATITHTTQFASPLSPNTHSYTLAGAPPPPTMWRWTS